MLILEGRIENGYGAARPNFEMQMPYFVETFPEIKGCYFGTINVRLDVPIKILKPDFQTTPIKWHPQHPNMEEVFSFTRINFQIVDGLKENQLIEAWIYDPQHSPHHRDPFYYEVVTSKIELSAVRHCRVYLNRSYKEDRWFIIE